MLKIVKAPHQVLSRPAKAVKKFDNTLKKLVKDMEKTLLAQKDPEGVGLAAPQVGISDALFIMKPTPTAKTFVAINPEIIEKLPVEEDNEDPEDTLQEQLEGCLSIPRYWAPVDRFGKVLLRYQTIEGTTTEKWFEGFEAIIVQHEVDHLKGILFTQRALEQNTHLFEEKNGKLRPVEIR